eukprot:2047521-Rhodomonas_salina.5
MSVSWPAQRRNTRVTSGHRQGKSGGGNTRRAIPLHLAGKKAGCGASVAGMTMSERGGSRRPGRSSTSTTAEQELRR